MRQGVAISASAHGALILLAFIGLPEPRDTAEVIPPQITDVSIVALSDLEASQSQAPETPDAPDLALNAPPPVPVDGTATPATEPPPETAEAARPNAPEAETAPDLSTLEQIAPRVITDLGVPEAQTEAAPLGIDTPLPDAPVRDGSVNSENLALLAPQTPNLAPRIDTAAAPKPPRPQPEAAEEIPQTAPAEKAEPEPEPEPEQDAAAPLEATTEITPEAEVQERPTTPAAATRPRGRPANLRAEAEQRAREAEEAAAALATAEVAQNVPEPDPAPDPAPEPEAPAPDVSEPQVAAPSNSPARLGTDFSSSEARAVGDIIGKSWNKTLIEGKDQFERLVVTIRVKMSADGKVLGAVEPVSPRLPAGDFKVAFEAARRAVLRAQPIPLPQGKFRDGDFLEIRFDPGRSAITLD